MRAEMAQTMILYVPDWFKDKVFVNWLNAHTNPRSGRPVATWHRRGKPNDYSDIFIMYDHNEGSELFQEDGMEFYWDEICQEAALVGFTYGIVWLKNIEVEE